MRELQSIQS